MTSPLPTTTDLEREIARRAADRLPLYTRVAWPHVEPGAFRSGWHIDAIGEHLMAVSSGEIRRIIVNLPPRHGKSLSCNVFWPSWDWIENPGRSFLFCSYRAGLSIRDQRKAKTLIKSDWHQRNFKVRVDPGNDTRTRWGTTAGGERMVSSVNGASSTGEGADIIVPDDPISADQARSPVQRQNVIDWWEETIKSRLNDPKTGAFVVIMQRFHEADLTGHILASETGWDHLVLPARYEPDHPFPIRSSIGFRDPRTAPGELLSPGRFGDEELNRIATPGSFADAGQLQQRPIPRQGGLFRREWFVTIPAAPAGVEWVRAWDLAATADPTAAYTAGVLLGRAPDGRFVIGDVARIQGTPAEAERIAVNTASQDAAELVDIRGSIPRDPGQSGKWQVAYLLRKLAAFNYSASPESGDKESRAAPLAAQAEVGNVLIVRGDWNKAFLDEAELFPKGKFKDQIDAASRAFGELVGGPELATAASGTYAYN